MALPAGGYLVAMNSVDSSSTLTLSAAQELMRKKMLSPWHWRAYTFTKLPSLALWRVRIDSLSAKHCIVSMPFSWRTQNPFKSVYFAAQNGAAELSTGALALLHLAGKEPASMLVVEFQSKYLRKAGGLLTFTCQNGLEIAAAVNESIATGTGQQVTAHSIAQLPSGEIASEFWITWSFRPKR